MRGQWSKRAVVTFVATAITAGLVAAATQPAAAASTHVTGAGPVTCQIAGKVKFAPLLQATPTPKTKLSIRASLGCSEGSTGYPNVEVLSGRLTATTAGTTAGCKTTNFGALTVSITWKTNTGSVSATKIGFATSNVTDGTAVQLDPGSPGPPSGGKGGSYAGEDVTLHIAGGQIAGGMCGGAAKGFPIDTARSSFVLVAPNPHDLPIQHVLVLMQENRSADTYFGQLHDEGQPDFEAEPTTPGNPDPTNPTGPPILPFHKTNYCEVADLDHSWTGTHNEIDGGLMDGFTKQNVSSGDPTGSRAMGYYDQSDLPYYYGLYNDFSTGDRYFASVPSQTYPNRLYLYAATSFGHIANDVAGSTQKSIFELLDAKSISWRIYTVSYPLSYAGTFFRYVALRAKTHIFPMSQYFTDLANDNLADVTFIDPAQTGTETTENDEHPPSNVQVGQAFVASVINGLMSSSSWSTSAFFLTYDEHGGYYDHVVPPAAVAPDNIAPKLQPGDVAGGFDQYGVRVPVAVVSPYSKPHHVSHVVDDHTSILKFIEYRYGLSSLTKRDAAADPMLDHFDFGTAALATPPTLPAAVIDPAGLAACQ